MSALCKEGLWDSWNSPQMALATLRGGEHSGWQVDEAQKTSHQEGH